MPTATDVASACKLTPASAASLGVVAVASAASGLTAGAFEHAADCSEARVAGSGYEADLSRRHAGDGLVFGCRHSAGSRSDRER